MVSVDYSVITQKKTKIKIWWRARIISFGFNEILDFEAFMKIDFS